MWYSAGFLRPAVLSESRQLPYAHYMLIRSDKPPVFPANLLEIYWISIVPNTTKTSDHIHYEL